MEDKVGLQTIILTDNRIIYIIQEKKGAVLLKKNSFICPECKTRYEVIGAMLRHRCEKCGADLVPEDTSLYEQGKNVFNWAIVMKIAGWIGVACAAVYGAMVFGSIGLCIGIGIGLLVASGVMTIADIANDIRRVREMMEEKVIQKTTNSPEER